MSKLHVKKGDKVLVIAGKDKGKMGEVLATNSAKSFVTVSGVNIQTHHNKPKSREDKKRRPKNKNQKGKHKNK